MMRRLIAIGIAWVAFLATGPSGATVIVEHVVPDPGSISFFVPLQVQVRLRWDGQGPLQAVFTSTTFDSSVFQFLGNTTAPTSVLNFFDNQGTPGDPDDDIIIPGLSHLGSIQQPGDPANILRTVQYGGLTPPDPRAATTGAGQLIMTLTFRMIGGGPLGIRGHLAPGDGIFGDQLIFVTTPEPGTSVLLGLGLTGMGWLGRRRSSGGSRPTYL